MSDLDIAGIRSLVDRAGVAIPRVAVVFQNAVFSSVDRFKLAFIWLSNADPTIVVGVIGQIGMLLRTKAHGCTSLAVRVMVKS